MEIKLNQIKEEEHKTELMGTLAKQVVASVAAMAKNDAEIISNIVVLIQLVMKILGNAFKMPIEKETQLKHVIADTLKG